MKPKAKAKVEVPPSQLIPKDPSGKKLTRRSPQRRNISQVQNTTLLQVRHPCAKWKQIKQLSKKITHRERALIMEHTSLWSLQFKIAGQTKENNH